MLDKKYAFHEATANNKNETKKDNKNNNMSRKQKILIYVICIIVFMFLSFILLISSISLKTKSNVIYKQYSNANYKVFLKPNNYYSAPYLDQNMQYIANLIDKIDINFNYNFNANQKINYRYSYYIKSDISVTNSDDDTKVIYSKTDRVTDTKSNIQSNSNGFNINENIKINYDQYNDLVKGFKNSYGISANSNLILSLVLDVQDDKGNKIGDLNNKDVLKLIIPLTEQMINIKIDQKAQNSSNTVAIQKDLSISNKITLILSIISVLISLAFIVMLILFILKTAEKKTVYDITLTKILREYDRVIANSVSNIELDGEIIDVNSFDELLDVRDNLEKPIVFNEVVKGKESLFVIKTPEETYRYILKLENLEDKKEKK